MALEESGLKLVAEGAAAYIADLGRADAATNKFATGLNQASDTVGNSGAGFNAFEEAATGSLRRVGEVAANFAGEAVQALGQFVAGSVSAAGDFEAGMNRFGAVTGDALEESGKSLEDFEQLFLDMGAQTQFSAGQAQDAAINLAKGGLDPATIAAGGLKAALDLAAAGELDLSQAAEISAKQYGVWVDASASASEKAGFLAESANLLAQAANASTVDVDDLALGLANAGGVAKVSGLSFRETVTTMGLLAPGFSSAADAGTSFKTFLSRLIPTTDSQSQAMAKLGLLTAEGTSKFYDAEGSFIGMEAAAQLLQSATSGLSNEQKQMALQTVFGSDAIRAAAILAEQGAEGYQRMAGSMNAAGTAAQQAAKRNQGFNFALESAKGSLETFGIVAGSLALPALTSLLNTGVIPIINGLTGIATALGDPTTGLGQMAAIISSAVVPALVGLGVATVVYAATQLPAMIAAVGASTTAFMAQAVAIAATALPLAAIAAAVGGVVWAYNDFNSKVSNATTQLLESREWWNASTVAIEAYNAAQLSTNPNIAATAATITQLRTQIQAEIEDLGRRSAAGLVSEQQYQTEMGAINAKADALTTATGYLNTQIEAENRAAASSMTATSQAAQLTDATALMGTQASLTAEDIAKLGEQIQKTYQEGGQAVGAYAQTEAEFLDGAEQRREEHVAAVEKLEAEKAAATTEEQKKAIDEQISALEQAYLDQETAQATSYAEQQAAQQAHLGQMLIDYTVGQATLGNITKEKAAEITAALEEQYGIQESSTATTFLNMAGEIDKFAGDSSGSIDTLIGALEEQQDAAVDTERAMTAMSKEYVATAVANFVEKGEEADAYAGVLKAIPKLVETEVRTKFTETGAKSSGGGGTSSGKYGGYDDGSGGGKAEGGPVAANMSYLVGEEGPEFFVPATDGVIVPAGISKALLDAASGRVVSPAGIGGGGGGTTVIYNENYQISVRDSSLTESQVEGAFVRALSQRTGRADRLARIGGGS
jgi:TP901 family phage tail tape measure protein